MKDPSLPTSELPNSAFLGVDVSLVFKVAEVKADVVGQSDLLAGARQSTALCQSQPGLTKLPLNVGIYFQFAS